MTEIHIERRSLPDQLRYLAAKLREDGSSRDAVALTLDVMAESAGPVIPDPLPMRSMPLPLGLFHVDGCDCGGLQWHAQVCTIWQRPTPDAVSAVEAAEAQLRAYTEALNATLGTAGKPGRT